MVHKYWLHHTAGNAGKLGLRTLRNQSNIIEEN